MTTPLERELKALEHAHYMGEQSNNFWYATKRYAEISRRMWEIRDQLRREAA